MKNKERQQPPFKVFVQDGMDWVIVKAGEDVRKAFKDFHGRSMTKKASVSVVPMSFKIGDIFNYTVAQGDWGPVKIV